MYAGRARRLDELSNEERLSSYRTFGKQNAKIKNLKSKMFMKNGFIQTKTNIQEIKNIEKQDFKFAHIRNGKVYPYAYPKFKIVKQNEISIEDFVRAIRHRKSMNYILDANNLKKDQLSKNVKALNGTTALIEATKSDQSAAFLYLVDQDVDITIRDRKGNTAMHYACGSGNLKNVEHLMKLGAYYTVASDRNKIGNLPLHVACKYGHLNVVIFLYKYSWMSLDERNYFGYTPIMLAAESGHTRIVEYLDTMGADLNRKNKFGKTALHRAAKYGHKSTSAYLLMNNADIYQQDSYGKNFLLDAQDLNFVEFLLFTLQKNEISTLRKHMRKNLKDVALYALLGKWKAKCLDNSEDFLAVD